MDLEQRLADCVKRKEACMKIHQIEDGRPKIPNSPRKSRILFMTPDVLNEVGNIEAEMSGITADLEILNSVINFFNRKRRMKRNSDNY